MYTEDDNTTALVIEGAELKPTVRMASSDTIHDLKWRIKDLVGVTISDQTLWSGDTKLCDTWTIENSGIGQGLNFSVRLSVAPVAGLFAITVEPQPTLHLNVSASGLLAEICKDCKWFEVKESQSVLELKEAIVERIKESMARNGVPASLETKDISLYRLGWFMQDGHKLSQYYVTNGCSIQLHGNL